MEEPIEIPDCLRGPDISRSGIDPKDCPFYVDLMLQVHPERLIHDPEWFIVYQELRYQYHRMYPDMNDNVRVAMLIEQIGRVSRLPEGDFIECGSLHGGSARIIWRMMRRLCPAARLFCFDTFHGFTQSQLDAETSLVSEHDFTTELFINDPAHVVARTITGSVDPDPSLVMVEGEVPASLAAHNDIRVRFAHLDVDLYVPIAGAMEWVWPRLVPGGVVIAHDYSVFEGVRRAVDEFCDPLGLVPVEFPDRLGSAVVYKPTR